MRVSFIWNFLPCSQANSIHIILKEHLAQEVFFFLFISVQRFKSIGVYTLVYYAGKPKFIMIAYDSAVVKNCRLFSYRLST